MGKQKHFIALLNKGIDMKNYIDWINFKDDKALIASIIKTIFELHGLNFNENIAWYDSSNIVCSIGNYCIKLFTPDYVIDHNNYEFEKESFILKNAKTKECVPRIVAEGDIKYPSLKYIITERKTGISFDVFKLYDLTHKLQILSSCVEIRKRVFDDIDLTELNIVPRIKTLNIPFKHETVKRKILNEVIYQEPMDKIVHCDLKWDNFVIGENDSITILDYGDVHIGPLSVELAVFWMRFIKKDTELASFLNKYGKEIKKQVIQGICYHPFGNELLDNISNDYNIDYAAVTSLEELYSVI